MHVAVCMYLDYDTGTVQYKYKKYYKPMKHYFKIKM